MGRNGKVVAGKRTYAKKRPKEAFQGGRKTGVTVVPQFHGSRHRVVGIKAEVGGYPKKVSKKFRRHLHKIWLHNPEEAQRQMDLVGKKVDK